MLTYCATKTQVNAQRVADMDITRVGTAVTSVLNTVQDVMMIYTALGVTLDISEPTVRINVRQAASTSFVIKSRDIVVKDA